MTLCALDASFMFLATDPGDPSMEDWLDAVSDHLAKLDAKDVSIISEGASGLFTVSLVVEASDDFEVHDVVKDGIDLLRTAFHACGAGTPGWPTARDAMSGVTVSFVESSQKVLAH